MTDAILTIVALECRNACENTPELEDRIRKSMAKVRDGHWMTLDEDVCFRGAVGGVLLDPRTTDEEKARIESSLSLMRAIGAATQGVPVDFNAALASAPTDPVPLVKIWHDLKTPTQQAARGR